jgi:hypothetical protein
VLVDALVAQPAVEALNETILRRFAVRGPVRPAVRLGLPTGSNVAFNAGDGTSASFAG